MTWDQIGVLAFSWACLTPLCAWPYGWRHGALMAGAMVGVAAIGILTSESVPAGGIVPSHLDGGSPKPSEAHGEGDR